MIIIINVAWKYTADSGNAVTGSIGVLKFIKPRCSEKTFPCKLSIRAKTRENT